MFKITSLSVSVADTPIIHNCSLDIQSGTVHAIMGANGSGKSTLAHTLMGHPAYTITSGSLALNGEDITTQSIDKRARAGIFLAFQQPYAIPGVTAATLLKEAYQAVHSTTISVKDFYTLLHAAMDVLGMDHAYAQRSINEGFSGGEKKKLEVLQMLVLKPQLVILDEIDSGLDVDALAVVARGIAYAREHNPLMSLVIITHYQRILQYLKPDVVHVMANGCLVAQGNHLLAQQIEQHGYAQYHD